MKLHILNSTFGAIVQWGVIIFCISGLAALFLAQFFTKDNDKINHNIDGMDEDK